MPPFGNLSILHYLTKLLNRAYVVDRGELLSQISIIIQNKLFKKKTIKYNINNNM